MSRIEASFFRKCKCEAERLRSLLQRGVKKRQVLEDDPFDWRIQAVVTEEGRSEYPNFHRDCSGDSTCLGCVDN